MMPSAWPALSENAARRTIGVREPGAAIITFSTVSDFFGAGSANFAGVSGYIASSLFKRP